MKHGLFFLSQEEKQNPAVQIILLLSAGQIRELPPYLSKDLEIH